MNQVIIYQIISGLTRISIVYCDDIYRLISR